MGISTVSGPFRSKNGFQELVNGEWVSVAGGGGGGGGANYTPLTWVDGQTVNVTVPTFTEVGQTVRYTTNLTAQSSGSDTVLRLVFPNLGQDASAILLKTIGISSLGTTFLTEEVDISWPSVGGAATIEVIYSGVLDPGGGSYAVYYCAIYTFSS